MWAAVTKEGWQLINNRNIFLTVLEAESVRSGMHHGTWLPHMAKNRERNQSSLVSSYKGTNSIHEGSAL